MIKFALAILGIIAVVGLVSCHLFHRDDRKLEPDGDEADDHAA